MSKINEFLNKCCVVDYEATGLDFRDAEVIEIGVTLRDGNDWTTESTLCKPVNPISPFISSITNITNKTVANEKHFDEIAAEYKGLLDAFPYLVAHNSFYESKMSIRLLGTPEDKWICTMRMAKYVFNDSDIESVSLPFLRYYLELPVDEAMIPHRAGPDSLMTAHAFESMLNTLVDRKEINPNEEIYPQLEDILSRPIIYKKMVFGKHKGQPMDEVPLDYLKWVITNSKQVDETAEEYDADLAATIEMYYLKKANN